MTLGNPLEAIVVIGVASACVLDAVDVAVVMHHLVEQRRTDIFDRPCERTGSDVDFIAAAGDGYQVSSLIEKCPYARGVD